MDHFIVDVFLPHHNIISEFERVSLCKMIEVFGRNGVIVLIGRIYRRTCHADLKILELHVTVSVVDDRAFHRNLVSRIGLQA